VNSTLSRHAHGRYRPADSSACSGDTQEKLFSARARADPINDGAP
jgi:hypothetical protein